MGRAMCVEGVSKRFLIGSARYSSLREVIARPVRKLLKMNEESETARTHEFWALRDVSFDVTRGSTLGIIGPNGSGKSTMLKILSRVTRPTSGSVTTRGRVSALIEVGAGFHQELTGRENVYLNGSILGMTRAEINRKFDAIVAFSGLEEFIDTPVKYYSSGMLVRLGFSVSAHIEPEILLVDEVLAVGDFRFRQKCVQRMTELIGTGITLVLVSHSMALVGEICKTCAYLEKGVLRHFGPTESAIASYVAMNGRAEDPLRSNGHILLGAEMLNAERQPALSVRTGEPVCLRLRMDLSRAPENCVLGLRIYDSSYELAAGTNTFLHGVELPRAMGRTAVDFMLENSWFKPGVYSVSVDIASADRPTNFERREQALAFSVLPGRVQTGTGYMEPAGRFFVSCDEEEETETVLTQKRGSAREKANNNG